MKIISMFLEKLHTIQFALSPHVTYTSCTEANDRMLMPFFRPSLAEPTVNTSCGYSFFLSVTIKHFTRNDAINQFEAQVCSAVAVCLYYCRLAKRIFSTPHYNYCQFWPACLYYTFTYFIINEEIFVERKAN